MSTKYNRLLEFAKWLRIVDGKVVDKMLDYTQHNGKG